MKSILAAECGSSTTTAVLLEQVDGYFRLKASGQTRASYGPPWNDIALSVTQAIRHIEQTVGRTLLTTGGWPITPRNAQGQGVDAFALVCSAAEPLQLIIAGLMGDVSLMSAQRAAATTYSQINSLISLDAAEGQTHTAEGRVQVIKRHRPDVILLVGGTDGGAAEPVLELARTLSIAIQTLHRAAPTVLYAGNQALRPDMADILGTVVALSSIDNVRPTLDRENLAPLQLELERLYLEKKMPQLPGFDKLVNWSQYPMLPASKSFEHLVTYVGHHHQVNVLGVSVGSRASTVVAQPKEGQAELVVRGDAGVGYGVSSLLKVTPIDQIQRWLPFDLSIEELDNYLLNKSLYPNTLPTSFEDLMIEQAVAREAIRLAAEQACRHCRETTWDQIIAAGRALTGAPQAMQAALLLLDGLEPWGVTRLMLDGYGLVNVLGAIAAIEPRAAAQAAALDTFVNLGTVIAPRGHGRRGQIALKLKLTYEQGETVEIEAPYGSLKVIGLPAGQTAEVEIRPARQFDLGLGQIGRAAKTTLEGGLLGLIIDARGRPLRFPGSDEKRIEQVQHWLMSAGIIDAATDHHHQPTEEDHA